MTSPLPPTVSIEAGDGFITDPGHYQFSFKGWSPDEQQFAIQEDYGGPFGGGERTYFVIDLASGEIAANEPDWIGNSVDSQGITIADPEQTTHFPTLEVSQQGAVGQRQIYPPIKLEELNCPHLTETGQDVLISARFSNSAEVPHQFDVSLQAASMDIQESQQEVNIPAGKTIAVYWQARPTEKIDWPYTDDWLLEAFRNDIKAHRRWLLMQSDSRLLGIRDLSIECYVGLYEPLGISIQAAKIISAFFLLIGLVVMAAALGRTGMAWLRTELTRYSIFTIAFGFIFMILVCVCILTLLGPIIGLQFSIPRAH